MSLLKCLFDGKTLQVWHMIPGKVKCVQVILSTTADAFLNSSNRLALLAVRVVDFVASIHLFTMSANSDLDFSIAFISLKEATALSFSFHTRSPELSLIILSLG